MTPSVGIRRLTGLHDRGVLLLEHTFIHIQGIGSKTEQRLWAKGIRSWRDFLDHGEDIFSPARDDFVRGELEDSISHRQDVRYFCDRLPAGETWRLFDAFRSRTVYLDIETSGGYQGFDEITVIGIYDGQCVQTFTAGINLDDFEIAISRYDLVITFGGSAFDLPFIRRRFPGISLPPGHIDLRFLFKKLGYAGGLKKIEKHFGIHRDAGIEGLNGFHAIGLWQNYLLGDPKALDTLIRYNRADTVNLEALMKIGYRKMKARLLEPGGNTPDNEKNNPDRQ